MIHADYFFTANAIQVIYRRTKIELRHPLRSASTAVARLSVQVIRFPWKKPQITRLFTLTCLLAQLHLSCPLFTEILSLIEDYPKFNVLQDIWKDLKKQPEGDYYCMEVENSCPFCIHLWFVLDTRVPISFSNKRVLNGFISTGG